MTCSPSLFRRAVGLALIVLAATATLLLGSPSTPRAHAAPTLTTVEPGVLTVGTEGTYAPFTYHENGTGPLTGFDVDIITDIAKKLGLRVKFVEANFDSLFPALEAGRFDLIANQISYSAERAAKYDLSDPYVQTASVIIARSDDTSIRSVDDLRGKTAAQSLTSNYAEIAKAAGAVIEPVDGFSTAIRLLDQGRVQATVNDELTAKNYLTSTGDTKVKIAATTPDVSRQVFAARKNSGLMPAINTEISALRDEGTLDKTYAKYFDATAKSPSSWDVVRSNLVPLLKSAITGTIPLTAISFVIGLAIALGVALARMSSRRIISGVAQIYISIIRGTPLLVQLFIIFYALPELNIVVSPFPAAIVAFSLNVGGYAAEIIRAAIESIPKGQWEAASTIGMNYTTTLRRIILPQAARTAVPPLSNTLISLVKDTSLASTILVTELFRQAQNASAASFDYLALYSTAAAYYLVICLVLSFGQSTLETRLRKYVAT
ncbi:ABC transporter substrate-binding protein/permease [Williamsia herbipolensis]|uniref:ABC transporter substrate-binding protein/permease n=1 Tax=Williamsia herbipolensis TaxID=1603258 RepID=A0AAU4K0J4_9NOCA|nr:ABC transporter substrate-binding protein/permease [Williamsia herbipolensis]